MLLSDYKLQSSWWNTCYYFAWVSYQLKHLKADWGLFFVSSSLPPLGSPPPGRLNLSPSLCRPSRCWRPVARRPSRRKRWADQGSSSSWCLQAVSNGVGRVWRPYRMRRRDAEGTSWRLGVARPGQRWLPCSLVQWRYMLIWAQTGPSGHGRPTMVTTFVWCDAAGSMGSCLAHTCLIGLLFGPSLLRLLSCRLVAWGYWRGFWINVGVLGFLMCEDKELPRPVLLDLARVLSFWKALLSNSHVRLMHVVCWIANIRSCAFTL
jgi:hypothetical protein